MIDKTLKRYIAESLDGSIIYHPTPAFIELYKMTGCSEKYIEEEYNILLRYKNNTAEEIEEACQDFISFQKKIIGMNDTSETRDYMYTFLDRLHTLGIDIDVTIPGRCRQKDWTYSEEKKMREYTNYCRRVNNSPTVIWTVEEMRKEFHKEFSQFPDKIKKKDLIQILKSLKKRKYIYEYNENDIYSGKPQYKKKKYWDHEFQDWDTYFEQIPFEKCEGDSYQKERKPFKVCLTPITPEDKYKKVKNFFWEIDEYKWRMEHNV